MTDAVDTEAARAAADLPGWDDAHWEGLLEAIKNQDCTPFLGAGACAGTLPLGRELAEKLADSCQYPFPDRANLPRVSQYIAVTQDPKLPRYRVRDEIQRRGLPDFTNPNEPHRLVADLRLPLYITTNFDGFLFQALSLDPRRKPKQEICKWHLVRRESSLKEWRGAQRREGVHQPGPDTPLVFHLHGHLSDLDSMVLTEDDYFDFLMSLSEVQELLPSRVEAAFVTSSLLFLGYSLEDPDFRVLFRKLASYMHRNEGARHVSVQLRPQPGASTEEQIRQAQMQCRYLETHFGHQKVRVYWGSCEQFAADLRTRWEKHGRD